jgi:tetratricopeptide (TPR) repeat protein
LSLAKPRRVFVALSTVCLLLAGSNWSCALAQEAQAVQSGQIEENVNNLEGAPKTRFRLKRPAAATGTGSGADASVGTASGAALNGSATDNAPALSIPGNTSPAASTILKPATLGVDALDKLENAKKTESKDDNAGKQIWRPGVILTGTAGTEVLSLTCDLSLAAKQAADNPTSPEAAFIHAVALTRSTKVEEALQEARRARSLARETGDPDYFNRAVKEYELSLAHEPENICVRYSLAWAYYMQAYLLCERVRKEEAAANPVPVQPRKNKKGLGGLLAGAAIVGSVLVGEKPPAEFLPKIPSALQGAPAWLIPNIKSYYQKSLVELDEVVKRDPNNAWALAYRTHLGEEYDGNAAAALQKLKSLKQRFPDNPAVAFFFADASMRNGDIASGAGSLGQALKMRLEGK